MRPIIKVQHLSKQYQIGVRQEPYGTLRESLVKIAKAPLNRFRADKRNGSTLWALKDVTFEVMPGEVIGIIGRNGAGKSTLLKILSRVTEPTTGKVELYGRVGSLLEVGTGFHPELSGRENVYLNGAILGMRRSEIERKFDEIVNFAELERFIETPVKHYSSGMYMRLAFAVAAHLEPEILIVDEVLAVGDEAFQRKCLGKMDDVTKHGRTVLLVSHALGMVSQLCAHAILLDSGEVKSFGKSKDVIEEYFHLGPKGGQDQLSFINRPVEDKAVQILSFSSVRESGEPITTFCHDELILLKIEFIIRQPPPLMTLGVEVLDQMKNIVFSSQTRCPTNSGTFTATMVIPRDILLPGIFSFNVELHHPAVESFEALKDIAAIRIIDPAGKFGHYGDKDHGNIFVDCAWDLQARVSKSAPNQ